MSWRPIVKVVVGFVVGLAGVGLVAAADQVGIDLRAPAAALLGVAFTTAAAYLKADPRVDQVAREPNGAAHQERDAD